MNNYKECLGIYSQISNIRHTMKTNNKTAIETIVIRFLCKFAHNKYTHLKKLF